MSYPGERAAPVKRQITLPRRRPPAGRRADPAPRQQGGRAPCHLRIGSRSARPPADRGGLAGAEGHEDDLVAAERTPVPGAVLSDEGARANTYRGRTIYGLGSHDSGNARLLLALKVQ